MYHHPAIFQFVGFWRTDKFTSATTTTTSTSCSSTRLATETRPSTSPSTSWRGRIKVLKSRENFWKDSCAELKTKVPRSKFWSALLKSFHSLSFIKSFYRCFSGRLCDFCPNFSSSSFLKDDLLMKREKADFLSVIRWSIKIQILPHLSYFYSAWSLGGLFFDQWWLLLLLLYASSSY